MKGYSEGHMDGHVDGIGRMDGILVVNKPRDHTSHDVVARLRGILRTKRIGHGGTLDPMAVGVLPIMVGHATKASSYLLGDKEYVAEAVFGLATDTQDVTGRTLESSDKRPTREELLLALESFRGRIMQVPPMVSAVKIDGKKLVDLHRRGLEVARPARPVIVHSLTLEAFSRGGCTLRAYVSKGTYIRTLVHELGLKLGCYAALSALTRTRSEPFSLDQSHTLEEIEQSSADGRALELLLPLDSLFAGYPSVRISGRDESLCRNGNPFPLPKSQPPIPPLPLDGLCRVYGEMGDFLVLGRSDIRDGIVYVRPEKVFLISSGMAR